jgi:hypothetical protein
MGYFLQCDVKGCDEIVPVPHANFIPKEWRVVVFEETDVEKQQLAKARMGYTEEMPGASMVTVKRSVYMCPAHGLPEFDDELGFESETLLPG